MLFGLASAFTSLRFFFFFFFLQCENSNITWVYYTRDKNHCLSIVHESHNTILTLKNYFIIVFSIFNFNKNKLYLNGTLFCNHLYKFVFLTYAKQIAWEIWSAVRREKECIF